MAIETGHEQTDPNAPPEAEPVEPEGQDPLPGEPVPQSEPEDKGATEALVELSQIGPDGSDERQKINVDEAGRAGEILADQTVDSGRLQDHLNFRAARAEETAAQGAEQTMQRAQWELSRDEEARAQGVDSIEDTTQRSQFRLSREEESRAEKLEEALHGAAEPVSIGQRSFAMQRSTFAGDDPPEREQPADETDAQAAAKQARGDEPDPRLGSSSAS